MVEAQLTAVRRRDRYAGQSRTEREAGRRDRIVAAAVHLFATLDYDEVSVADVCTHAKVSKRYFYDYFVDRADLLAAVHKEQNDWLISVLTGIARPRPRDLEGMFRPVMAALVRVLREHPERARIIYVNAPRMELRRRGLPRAEAAVFGDLIRELIGAPRDEELFRRAVLTLVAGVTEVVLEWVNDDFADPPGPLAEHLTAITVAVLAAVPTVVAPVPVTGLFSGPPDRGPAGTRTVRRPPGVEFTPPWD